MAFSATPLFPGDLYDTSLRLAASPERAAAQPTDATPSSAKWRQMLELGWQGVIVPEAAGGVDGRLADLAAIVEASARHALTAPLIDRCAVAPALLASLMAQPQVCDLLEAIALGSASAATVLDASPRLPGTPSGLRLSADGRLNGTLKGVDLSEPASHLLFNTVDHEQQAVLVLLPTDGLLPWARRFGGMDGRVSADFNLDGHAITAEQVLSRGPELLAAIELAQQTGSLLTCVQAVGAAGAMIEQTIEYLGTRVQFGVQLATFQALRHRVVEMYVAFENASGLVQRLVAQARPDRVGAARDLALLKLYVGNVSRMLSEVAIQLHGGMGMTWETLVARLAMHSLMGSLQFGDSSQCLDWLTARTLADARAEVATA